MDPKQAGGTTATLDAVPVWGLRRRPFVRSVPGYRSVLEDGSGSVEGCFYGMPDKWKALWCSRDLERLYPKETDIVKEFHYIETQLTVSVPVEELLLSLGDRSGIEDVENFAAVFYTAKRTGGDMNRIIQTSARMLGDKIDVRKEIETTLAAKKAEQMIMSLMPVGIILYLQMTSPGFLSVLYGNPFGIAAMSICLAIYATAYWLGRRIVDIEV